MDRRSLLKSAGTLALLGSLPAAGPSSAASAASATALRRVRPYDPEWPSAAEWENLRMAVGGRLERVASPLDGCARDAAGRLCEAALKDFGNPFYIQDQAAGTQSQGWVDAWTAAPSVYAVVPQSAADIAAAVNFAREKNLRLVVKGGAHSYLGQSNAPDSLLIWMRDLNGVELHDAFVPAGCESTATPRPAVSVGSGARFIELYDATITKGGRYVQGGGCTSVGVGGHVQTGGFGSFSKYGGLVAGSLLEAEIVTADGRVRVVNECHDPDLFAALRGGGAGFGITTRLTLATHEIPEVCGFLGQTVRATGNAGFRQLLGAFAGFADAALINPHWGEQVTVKPDNTLEFAMVFQGLSEDEVRAAWAPFWTWLADHPDAVADAGSPRIVSMPGRHWWDHDYRKTHFPNSIIEDSRPGAAPGRFWWSGNDGEVGIFLSGYESLWLPEALLAADRRDVLADALFAASRHYAVGLHFNKGLAGAPEARKAEARASMVHPDHVDAFALAIIAGGQAKTFPGVLGHEPDRDDAREDARRIAAAMTALRQAAPDAGSYSSEMSYFETDWQRATWGPHYPKLLATKNRYDPDGLFTGRHQVGSEVWSADGFVRIDR